MTDILRLSEGLPRTAPIYWRDSYLTKYTSNILRTEHDEKNYWYVVLDETIFHPKGGGQPSDRGVLEGSGFKLEVKKAMLVGQVIVHWGKVVAGQPAPGVAEAQLDWEWRYLMMRRHSAGHLMDHCLTQVMGPEVETLDSWLGDPCYVAYKGEPPSTEQLAEVELLENDFIAKGAAITTREVSPDELRQEYSGSPNFARLPHLKQLRLVTIQGCMSIACGGTHLRNVSEAKRIKLDRTDHVENGFRVRYDVT